MEAQQLYDEACYAGDVADYMERLSAAELKGLHHYCVCRMAQNDRKGGIPAILKWACALEAAKRFLS